MEEFKFDINEVQKLSLTPLSLAFMGDAVYEILVRKKILENNLNLPVSKLHSLAVEKVKAFAQAKAYDYIKPYLSEKELEILKRGRNNNSTHYPRNSNPIEYRKATGLESLFGFWFVNNNFEKILFCFEKIYNFLESRE